MLNGGGCSHRRTPLTEIPCIRGNLQGISGRSLQNKSEIWALNLATGERRYLFDGSAPSYVGTGQIVYAQGESFDRGSLWSVPFDADRMVVTGPAHVIQSAVAGSGGSAYAVAYLGPLVYLPAPGDVHGELVLREPDGTSRVLAQQLGTGLMRQRLDDPTSRETLVAHEKFGQAQCVGARR